MKPRPYSAAALLASLSLLLPAAAAVPASATTPAIAPGETARSSVAGDDGLSPTGPRS